MLLRRFYDDKLAQASYLVGCDATGDALIVDPNRDVETYVRAAEMEGLRITHVTETHIHADFVSGVRELAARTGAKMFLSAAGTSDWQYEFVSGGEAALLKDGAGFKVGRVRIEAIHTPGHTPEHLTYLVTDTAAADRPMGAFTGDFIFVGDVGRPDLLERAAMLKGTMEEAARTLYRSIQEFRSMPDYLQIWPGHGAGSACGRALGAVPQSTLGYERMFSWAFASKSESDFVRDVLAGQPEPPKYFAEMKRINKSGPSIVGGFRRPEQLPESKLPELLDAGALIVDTRPHGDFAEGHVPGTLNLPLDRTFPTWAGWLLPYDRDFYLVVEDQQDQRRIDEATRDLHLIGLDRIAGYFGGSVMQNWARERRALETIDELSAEELRRELADGEVSVIDVRGRAEWEAGHIPDVPNYPLGYLTDHLDQIPTDRTVVLHCQEGWRSGIAASVLRAHGYTNAVNLRGGIRAWAMAGNPIVRE